MFHESTVHASPLLYDWDLDGTPDILVVTYDGEVMAFKDTVGGGGVGGVGYRGGGCRGRPCAGGEGESRCNGRPWGVVA